MTWLYGGMLHAQPTCLGDLTGDGIVSTADVSILQQLFFDDDLLNLLQPIADANQDGSVNAGDLVAVVPRVGRSCSPPTPTRAASASPTRTLTPSSAPVSPNTPTRSWTPTRSPTPTMSATFTLTPTPTVTCVATTLAPGTTVNGSLTAADCPRLIAGSPRLVDVYQIPATSGSSLRVELIDLDPGLSSPWVVVLDPNAEFTFGHGRPPVEWAVTANGTYVVYVTSDPWQPQQMGAYKIRVTSRVCPTPRSINLTVGFSMSNLKLESSDCPDPAVLGTNGSFDPVDVYTFHVDTVPTQVDIVMRQLVEDDALDPTFAVLGPDGVEVISADDVDDAAGGRLGVDAEARFLALRPGLYTLLVGGGVGRYSLVVFAPQCRVTTLPALPPDRPLLCPGQAGPGCEGTLYGSRINGTCGGPLPAYTDEEVPAVNAGANVYALTANAGDYVSVGVEVEGDDAYALLLGPNSEGNPIVAYDSSALTGEVLTQLGATIVKSGTYSLVLGNVSPLSPPDPSIEDPGDVLPYRFYSQKCPVAGVLSANPPQVLQSAFRVTDCLGPGGTPHRNYVLPAQAGDFIMVELNGDASVDPALRLWAPNGSVAENDEDPFGNGVDARVARILPEDGNYFVEVYSAPEGVEFDPQQTNAFQLRVHTCPVRSVAPGVVTGVLDSQDCAFSTGQRYEVWTWTHDGTEPSVASFFIADGLCAQALLPSGEAVPYYECAEHLLEVPMVQPGTYGLIVTSLANEDPSNVVLVFRRCNVAAEISYGQRISGNLELAPCLAGDGLRAEWYWVAAGENVLRFNQGLSGFIESDFRAIVGVTDRNATTERDRLFAFEPETMLRVGPERRAGLMRVRSVGVGGAYTVVVDPAAKRE